MRKGRDRGNGEKNGEEKKEKTDENSGHYVIASTLVPIIRSIYRALYGPKVDSTFSPI